MLCQVLFLTTLLPNIPRLMAILLSTVTASLGMGTEGDTENMGTDRLAYVDMDVLTVVIHISICIVSVDYIMNKQFN